MIPERLELITRADEHMRRNLCSFVLSLALFLIIMVVLVTAPTWGEWVDSISAPPVAAKPAVLSKVFRCPDKQPGLSDTIVIYIHEDTDGAVRAWECVRIQERGKRL